MSFSPIVDFIGFTVVVVVIVLILSSNLLLDMLTSFPVFSIVDGYFVP